jgi:hypothetical protein
MTSVKNLLKKFDIDQSGFGRGNAKTIDDLEKEIANGECALVEKGGLLVRYVHILNIDVFAKIEGRRLYLREIRQKFADGRIRERKLPASLSEKLALTEKNYSQAIERTLTEEIQVQKFSMLSAPQKKPLVIEPSMDYPGILTEYKIIFVAILINPIEYKPDGYREIQTDKTTFFEWSEFNIS